MVNIEPYEYQRKTNIKEHNDLVAKINEIVDVINNTNMETIIPRISKLETDVSGLTDNDSIQNTDISSLKTKTAKLETDVSAINNTDSLQWQDIESVKGNISTITPKITKLEQDVTDINSTDAVQNTDISNLKAKETEQDNRLGSVDTEIEGITKSLVSDVAILNGTTSGNVKVRIERGDAPSIDSNDYNLQKPTSVELVQGSAPAMVKAQITLSDGTVLISDDFMFTTEAIGQDVYISSFVFKNGNVAGTISADIGLSNGSTLTANNFAVPTDPNVTTAISDLQGKVTTVENDVSGLKTKVSGHTTSINNLNSEVSNLQTRVTTVEGSVSGLDELKVTVEEHTTSINNLDNDVADLQIGKADANNGNQSIVAGSISATNITKGGVAVATVNDIPVVPDISGKVDKAQGIANAGKVLGINASGNVEPVTVESGGEVWEEVNLSNFPTDWAIGDRVKIDFKLICDTQSPYFAIVDTASKIIEFEIPTLSNNIGVELPISFEIPGSNVFRAITCYVVYASKLNNSNERDFLKIKAGSGTISQTIITKDNIANYARKMWRLKK